MLFHILNYKRFSNYTLIQTTQNSQWKKHQSAFQGQILWVYSCSTCIKLSFGNTAKKKTNTKKPPTLHKTNVAAANNFKKGQASKNVKKFSHNFLIFCSILALPYQHFQSNHTHNFDDCCRKLFISNFWLVSLYTECSQFRQNARDILAEKHAKSSIIYFSHTSTYSIPNIIQNILEKRGFVVKYKMSCHSPSGLEATSFTIPGLIFWTCVVLHLYIHTYMCVSIYAQKKSAYCFPSKVTFFTRLKKIRWITRQLSVLNIAPFLSFFLLQGKKKKRHLLSIYLFELIALVAIAIALVITIVITGRDSATLFGKFIGWRFNLRCSRLSPLADTQALLTHFCTPGS